MLASTPATVGQLLSDISDVFAGTGYPAQVHNVYTQKRRNRTSSQVPGCELKGT